MGQEKNVMNKILLYFEIYKFMLVSTYARVYFIKAYKIYSSHKC